MLPLDGKRGPLCRLYDSVCVCLMLLHRCTAQCGALWRLDAGAMYFWLKDLTQEFLKLSIIYSSLEILDKVCRTSNNPSPGQQFVRACVHLCR